MAWPKLQIQCESEEVQYRRASRERSAAVVHRQEEGMSRGGEQQRAAEGKNSFSPMEVREDAINHSLWGVAEGPRPRFMRA